MKVFQETTEWDWPNHIYFLSDSKDKIFGYIKRGSDQVETIKKPYRFFSKNRTFKEVPNTWGFKIAEEPVEEVKGKQYRVPGSTGTIYTVTDDAGVWTCTCPASRWSKDQCKHIQALKSQAPLVVKIVFNSVDFVSV